MFSVVAGTILLAMVHALIPNHWLPLVAVARAEQWKQKDVTTITLLAALAHVTGTVALGLVLGLIGKELVEKYGTAIYVGLSVLLIVFGLVYYTVNLPHHHHSGQKDVAAYKRSKRKWVAIFIVMMFLSPCLEVESLFLSAGAYGMGLVTLLAVVYAIVNQKSQKPITLFIEYRQQLQTPFIKSYVPLLPYNSIVLGCTFPLIPKN